MTACPDIRLRILALVTHEHNGYKLVLEYSSVLVEHLEAGYISIVSLVQVGNVIPLLIFIMICFMARLPQRPVADKIIVLAPVAYFILQLQYAEALDFASCSLQVLGVVFFSLLSIYLLGGGSSLKFTLACASLVLAVASSPNGFFLMPVGCLLLAQRRRWAGAITWAVLTLLMLFVYMFHYLPFSTNKSRPSATYALSFLGSAAAGYQSKLSIVMSISLGAVFFAVAVTAFIRRYHKRNPPVFYSMLFILLTAVAVSSLRSDAGVAQSLSSRYRIYSDLFLALSYIFGIEELLSLSKTKRLRQYALVGIGSFSAIFCFLNDWAGARVLQHRKQAVNYIYRVQWLTDPSAIRDTRTRDEVLKYIHKRDSATDRLLYPGEFEIFEMDLPTLREAESRGIYQPPYNVE